jgi:hypothetical protein
MRGQLTVAGRTSEAVDSVIREQVVWAVVSENLCSIPFPFPSLEFLIPPKKKHMPMTRRRFDRMEPSIDACTTSISPAASATMLTWCVNQSVSTPPLSNIRLIRIPRRTRWRRVALTRKEPDIQSVPQHCQKLRSATHPANRPASWIFPRSQTKGRRRAV